MWNNWINQIQEKIDGAVDLLREDEEDEEYEAESGSEGVGSARAQAHVGNSAPPLPSPSPSLSASRTHPGLRPKPVAKGVTQGGGWDDDDDDPVVSPAAPAGTTPTAPLAATLAPTSSSKTSGEDAHAAPRGESSVGQNTASLGTKLRGPAPPLASTELSTNGSPLAAATDGEGGSTPSAASPRPSSSHGERAAAEEPTESVSEGSGGCRAGDVPVAATAVSSGAAANTRAGGGGTSTFGTSATLEATPHEGEGAAVSPSPTLAATPPVGKAEGDGEGSAGVAAPLAEEGHREGHDAGLSRATPIGTPRAGEDGLGSTSHAQLMRFQQQLAEEMATSAALSEENGDLRRRLADAEAALAAARASAASASGAKDQLSTLIEKLGREREKCKIAVEERDQLRDQIVELDEMVEELRMKEAVWESGAVERAQSQSAAQAHVNQLEEDLRRRTARLEALEERLAESERARTRLSTQLQEVEKQRRSAVQEVADAGAESRALAEREVEQLRAALRRTSAEQEERVLSLEQELREANLRAHQAEERLHDLERASVGSLRDLRTELEDMQRRMSGLTSELAAARDENADLMERYSSLKRMRANEESAARERLAARTAAVAALTEENVGLRRSLAESKDSARVAEGEIGELRRRCTMLEGANAQLKAAAPFSTNTGDSNSFVGSQGPASPELAPASDNPCAAAPPPPGPTLGGGSSEDGTGGRRGSGPSTPASLFSRGLATTSLLPPPPLFTPTSALSFGAGEMLSGIGRSTRAASAVIDGDAAGSRSRSRLEREIVRQAVVIERLQKGEEEAKALRTRLAELEAQYDVLLQLYGQTEEELKAAKAAAPQT